MVRRIIRIIGICDDEWSRLLSMSNLIFFLMIGWAFGSSAGDSFFIKEAGPLNLPYAYIFKACLEITVAAVYSRMVDRIARYRFFIVLLGVCSAVLLAVRILIPFKYLWMPFAVFSLSDVITTIIFMHFWTYANDIFDPREGKRIFPLIGGLGLIGHSHRNGQPVDCVGVYSVFFSSADCMDK
ncbi:MAG: hypothetical protein M1426_04180 [Patescibacteria group bacterium]|nr:hypothetical protein [Patescibacteria group bacterium]